MVGLALFWTLFLHANYDQRQNTLGLSHSRSGFGRFSKTSNTAWGFTHVTGYLNYRVNGCLDGEVLELPGIGLL